MSHDSVSIALGDRRVLPRWRAPIESVDEFAPVHPPQSLTIRSGWIEKLEREFSALPNIESGRDLFETAQVLGKDLPHSTSQEILRSGYTHTTAHLIANKKLLTTENTEKSDEKIKQLRASLKLSVKQPLAWTELARHYLTSASPGKAEKAMQCALALAPKNRYILRSAARLFELIGDPDQGLHALKLSGRLSTDPWLLSADIALNGNKQSNSIKIGMRMLEGFHGSPRNFTELAAAIGTVEHVNGRHKQAKKMFAQSLLDPNENSIAQAIYISQNDNNLKLSSHILNQPLTYEARARHYFATAAWNDSMDQSRQWLRDEPFDARPAILGSCLSFIDTLTEQAFDIATEGLKCTPNDALLLNNRAVAGAYLGRLDSAFSDLNHAIRANADRAYSLATLGLIAYRFGNPITGARAYEKSISWSAENKDYEAVFRAYLYWLREAIRSHQIDGITELETARKISEKRARRDLNDEISGLLDAIEKEIASRNHLSSPHMETEIFNIHSLLNTEEKLSHPLKSQNSIIENSETSLPSINKIEKIAHKK